jgi:hypothetical protein
MCRLRQTHHRDAISEHGARLRTPYALNNNRNGEKFYLAIMSLAMRPIQVKMGITLYGRKNMKRRWLPKNNI